MDRRDALGILGLSAEATNAEVRDAHRRRIRAAHPDAGGSARDAALVNAALETIRATSSDQPIDAAAVEPLPPDVDHLFVVHEQPTALLSRLTDAGHDVGEVVFVDPEAGLLEIVVGNAPAVGQLAVTVGAEGVDGTPVSFTLEPLGVTPAPLIADVVDALMAALRR